VPTYAPPPEVTAAGEMQAANTFGAVLPQMRDAYAGMQAAGEFPVAQGQTPYNLTPAGLEDRQSPQDTLRAQLLGQPATQGYVPTVPTDYTESPLTSAVRVASGPLQVYQGLNADIPIWSDIARDYVVPAVNAVADPLGIQSFVQRKTIGSNIGMGDLIVPIGALDVGLNLATGGGFTGFDDLARAGTRSLNAVDNVVRGAFPEPSLLPGYSAGVPPPGRFNPLGGENAFGPGSRGAMPNDTAFADAVLRNQTMSVEDQLSASLPPSVIDQQRAIMAADPETARSAGFLPREAPVLPAERYPSFPEGTMGERFPDAVDMQPRGPRAIDPDSPAARMGAPLAYDPQYTPGTREYVAREAYEAGLPGGGSAPSPPSAEIGTAPPVSPPPASPFADVGAQDAARYADASARAREAFSIQPTPNAVPEPATFPMVPDEAIAIANRIGFPIDEVAIQRGSPLYKGGEYANLAAAIDFHNFKNGYSSEGSALDYVLNAFREDAARMGGGGAGNASSGGLGGVANDPTVGGSGSGTGGGGGNQAGAGGGAGGRGASGGNGAPPLGGAGGGSGAYPPPDSVNTPAARALWNKAMEVAYLPLSGDVGVLGRQDITRTANILRAGETREVLGIMVRAGASRDEATKIASQFESKIADWEKAYGQKLNLADWAGTNLTNRETMQSSLTNGIPIWGNLNRMNATELNARRVIAVEHFIDAHGAKLKPAEVRDYMNYVERVTGRGAIPFEDVLSKLGPLFTSMRFALSIPERVPYLVPVRVVEGKVSIADKVWRETVKDHAGFAATLGGTLLLAQQAGLNVDFETGTIKIGNTSFNLTGGIAGYWNTIQKMADGDLMAGADFVRNKMGPLPGALLQGTHLAGIDKALGIEDAVKYLRPDFFNRGATGTGEGWDRALGFVMPLWLQDVAQAVRFAQDGKGLQAGLRAAPASLFGLKVDTYPGTGLSNLRAEYKDDPRQPEAIRGVEYKDLGPDGKAVRDELAKTDKPDEYEKAKSDRDEYASNPVFTKYHEAVDKANQQADQRKTDLYNMLRDGKITGEQLRQGRDIVNSSANAQRTAARNDPEYKKALSELERSDVYKALDVYYQIYDKAPKLANGKPDYDWIEQKQADFLKFAEQKNPETAKLLRFEVETNKERTNPLDRLYDLAKPMLERYGAIKDDYARSMAQRNNPREDAFLALLGYGKTQSPQAAQILTELRSKLPGTAPVAAGAPVQRSTVAPPSPAPLPQPIVAPLATGGRPAPTGAVLPPVAPGEFNSATASPQQRVNFINAMTAPAIAWSQATGIPPSVYAAMGASESNWGRAPSVFGIKGSAPSGGSANLATHEVYGGKNVNINDQFAAYKGLDEAFNHFNDLTSSGRYAPAREYLQQTGDWYGFLRGITDAGYATAKNWPESIRDIAADIERNYPQLRR